VRENLQHHHLVTRSEGGGDEEANLITLCAVCHAKLHKRQGDGFYNASARQRAGIEAAKARGVYKGRKARVDRRAVTELRKEGLGATAIAKSVGCGRASVYRVLKAGP
jgi:hypothetical protein